MDPTIPQAAGAFDPEALVKKFQTGVWRYLRAMGCSPSLAEDLTQETFLRVLQKPFTVYDDTATAGYLRRVAYTLFVSNYRRQSKSLDVDDFEVFEETWLYWVRDDSGAEMLLALRDCLQTLTPRVRDALRLRYEEQLPRAEIGRRLQMSEHGAKNLIQRAKKKLRDCVQRKVMSPK
jgi:RNA polymerase sigma-70 factor (ECF subfamily)